MDIRIEGGSNYQDDLFLKTGRHMHIGTILASSVLAQGYSYDADSNVQSECLTTASIHLFCAAVRRVASRMVGNRKTQLDVTGLLTIVRQSLKHTCASKVLCWIMRGSYYMLSYHPHRSLVHQDANDPVRPAEMEGSVVPFVPRHSLRYRHHPPSMHGLAVPPQGRTCDPHK